MFASSLLLFFLLLFISTKYNKTIFKMRFQTIFVSLAPLKECV